VTLIEAEKKPLSRAPGGFYFKPDFGKNLVFTS